MASRGNGRAANELGIMYAAGISLPQNFTEAKKWFDYASQKGESSGEYNLGVAYLKGEGTPIDLPEAIRYFQTAAEHGSGPAMVQLAMMHRAGTGGLTPNDEEAARLARSAAIQGYGPGQGLIAIFYRDGTGVEPNDILTYEWASLASARLQGQAAETIRNIRDQTARHLSPAALAAAQVTTANWKPGQDLVPPAPDPGAPSAPSLRGNGSGLIIGKEPYVVTAHHVISACREIKLRDADGDKSAVTHVVARDKASDLALLAGVEFGSPLKMRASPARLGETVTSFGFPLSNLLASSGNLTTGTVSSTTGMQGDSKTFQFTAPVQPGNSGGPIVDEYGNLIGVAVGKLNAVAIAEATGDIPQNVSFATNAERVRSLLDANGVRYDLADTGKPRSSADIADQLRRATVKVECWR